MPVLRGGKEPSKKEPDKTIWSIAWRDGRRPPCKVKHRRKYLERHGIDRPPDPHDPRESRDLHVGGPLNGMAHAPGHEPPEFAGGGAFGPGDPVQGVFDRGLDVRGAAEGGACGPGDPDPDPAGDGISGNYDTGDPGQSDAWLPQDFDYWDDGGSEFCEDEGI